MSNNTTQKKRVLIVEDEPDSLYLVQQILSQAGYETMGAPTGEKALELLQEECPDMMLLDHQLPDINGDEIVERMNDEECQTPFVVMTGYNDAKVAVKMMKLGALDYIFKDKNFLDFLITKLDKAFEKLVSDKKLEESEKKCRENEAKLSTLFEETLNPIFVVNEDQEYLYANQAGLDFLECSLEALRDKTVWDFSVPDKELETIKRDHSPFGERRNLETEYFVNGKIKTLQLNVVPVEFEDEKLLYGIGLDITELKETQQKFLREKNLTQRIMEASPVGIVVLNLEGEFIFANKRAEQVLGLKEDELTERTYNSPEWKITDYSGEPLKESELPFQKVIKNRQAIYGVRHAIEWKDGWRVFLSVNAVPLFDENGKLESVVVSVENITEKLFNQKKLEQNEKRFRELFDNMSSGVIIFDKVRDDREFIITDINKACEQIDDLTKKEAIGSGIHEIYPDIEKSGLLDKIRLVWKTERPQEHRRVKHKENQISDWKEYYIYKLPNQDVVCVYDDITEQKILEAQLRQSQKMEAVGKLAGGVAHDFNNLLTAISCYSDFVLMHLKENDPLRSEMKQIRKAINRAASLTRQLLVFSRQQMTETKVYDLNHLIKDMENMLRRLIGEDIDLIIKKDEQLWNVKVDPNQIEQVIMNLVVNARDALHHGGKLIVSTENVILDDEYCLQIPYSKPGNYVRLSIEDTGRGMDDETKQNIFKPFYTTKGKGKGTGIGLAVVLGIIKQHGGWINVYSTPGHGTVFKIYLPALLEEKRSTKEEETDINKIRGNGERILLVEDEEIVRKFAAKSLRKHGYVVAEAAIAEEALEIFKSADEGFDLLFTDSVLPDHPGIELVEQIRQIDPNMHILVTSGYTDQRSQWATVKNRGFNFLQKPYSLTDLYKMIRMVLDSC